MADLPAELVDLLRDRYLVKRELGRGGMATVYLAEDLRHGRDIALKVLHPELSHALGPERFVREIKFAARLQHPHILTVHDSGEVAGRLWFTMPFVEGESLRDRLKRERQLPVGEAVRIAREVGLALDYAHRHGVVHRDIKPENILLCDGQALVADFGIGRAFGVLPPGETLTDTGMVVGTPAYMSPEQAAGDRLLDGRSDIYALGCVLFEMLAGEPPFTGPSPQVVIARRFSEPVPHLSALRQLPPGLDDVVTRALARVPADRFQTAAEMAEALEQRDTLAPPAASPETRRRFRGTRAKVLAGLVAVVALVGGVLVFRSGGDEAASAGSTSERTAIAVLPFQNLSAEGPHAHFAGGLHDELLTQLSKVSALKVISRTSVMGYAGARTPLRQIASELGVGSVVEGSVQVMDGRLRVNVQLIDAATDAHLWAERYDRRLEDAFAIQSDVAQRIVAAVGAALTSTERQGLADAPTANPEAYQLYLQGLEYWTRTGSVRKNFEIAQQLFERALALEPSFALAHAKLSEVHDAMYWQRFDPSPARLARSREEAETALRLAPDLPEAHVAMGGVLWEQDLRRALEHFRTALHGLPNDAGLWSAIGSIQQDLGNWNQGVAAQEKAAQLDPRSPDLLAALGFTYEAMHRYPEAVRMYDRALALAPDLYEAAMYKGITYFLWQGRLDTLRAVVQRLPDGAELSGFWQTKRAQHLQLLYWERNADSMLHVLRTSRVPVLEGAVWLVPAPLYAAWAHRLRGDRAAALSAFDSARVILDSLLKEFPDDYRVHWARGLALAGLGRRAEARREAAWLEQSPAFRAHGTLSVWLADGRARILANAGDVDAALDEIARLLPGPSWLSMYTLRQDLVWEPLRGNPRFERLVAGK